jgi:hypothetical protein
LLGGYQRRFQFHDAELCAISGDHAERTDANLSIDANTFCRFLNGR